MRIFISYSHQQADWVWERLQPVLQAAGAEVLIDKSFVTGKPVVGQMDALQDQAEQHLLVLSPEYLASQYCQHEMRRALKQDPTLAGHKVLPVLRVATALPKPFFTGWNSPLYSKLDDDSQAAPWDALLAACGADALGVSAPEWLAARDDSVRYLQRKQSVNLVCNGNGNWRAMLAHLAVEHFPAMATVDLHDPDTTSRRGLLMTICQALGERNVLPPPPEDLPGFKRLLQHRSASLVALSHFDLAPHRSYYDLDMYASLRYAVMDMQKLTLLVQSRSPFAALLPVGHPLSAIDIKSVELRGRR